MTSGNDDRPGPAGPDDGDPGAAWWTGSDADPGRDADSGPDPDSGPGAGGHSAAPAGRGTGGDAPDGGLPTLPPSSRSRRAREPWIPESPPLRTLSGPDIAGVVLLGALGIGVAVVLGLFVLHRFSDRDPVPARTVAAPTVTASSAPARSPTAPGPTASATPSPSATATLSPSPSPTTSAVTGPPGRIRGIPYAGRLTAVSDGDISDVTASCTGDPTTNRDGTRVTYDASNAVDGDPTTAWRCAGRGIGESLTITFDRPVTLGQIGIVNGYAKTDPDTGADLYRQDRRVLRARWTTDGDRWVEERPDTSTDTLQTFRIPPTTTSQVVVQIRATSSGRRNIAAISELSFAEVAGG